MAEHLPPETLNDWVAAVADEVGIDAASVPIAEILDLAKHVAHGVARPAAPVTAFLVGYALAAGSRGSGETPGGETPDGETPNRTVNRERLAALSKQMADRAATWRN